MVQPWSPGYLCGSIHRALGIWLPICPQVMRCRQMSRLFSPGQGFHLVPQWLIGLSALGKPISLRTSFSPSSSTNCEAFHLRQESKCLLLVKVKVRTETCERTWAPNCEATSFWWIVTRGNQCRSLRRTTWYLVSKRITANLLRCYLIKTREGTESMWSVCRWIVWWLICECLPV